MLIRSNVLAFLSSESQNKSKNYLETHSNARNYSTHTDYAAGIESEKFIHQPSIHIKRSPGKIIVQAIEFFDLNSNILVEKRDPQFRSNAKRIDQSREKDS